MQKEKKYLLKKELATRYRVSTSTIERWVSSNILSLPMRVGPNRILWDIEEIIEWEKCKKEERNKCQ